MNSFKDWGFHLYKSLTDTGFLVFLRRMCFIFNDFIEPTCTTRLSPSVTAWSNDSMWALVKSWTAACWVSFRTPNPPCVRFFRLGALGKLLHFAEKSMLAPTGTHMLVYHMCMVTQEVHPSTSSSLVVVVVGLLPSCGNSYVVKCFSCKIFISSSSWWRWQLQQAASIWRFSWQLQVSGRC